jgi:hypothetical protein
VPEPTHDTPQERDDKADALEEERLDMADVLARQFTRFKWETRGYYALLILYLISEIF